MEEALAVDPGNGRARAALASLHAGEAGIVLARLVDPLYKASEDLDAPQAALVEERRRAHARDVEESMSKNRATSAADARSRKALNDIKNVLDEAGAFLANANLALIVFDTLPRVSVERTESLEKAIAVLRDGSVAPGARDEETRLYLAILGGIRFVGGVRTILGTDTFAAGDFLRFRSRLCAQTDAPLRAALADARTSLGYMEEGLTHSPDDPDTSKRRRRKRLQEFVTKFLTNGVFARADVLFDPRSQIGGAAREVADAWCAGDAPREAARPLVEAVESALPIPRPSASPTQGKEATTPAAGP
jgi:hypothetical protein